MDQNQNSNNNTNSQSQTNQNLNNEINSQPQLSEKEIKKQETHEASQKTAHVAGKGLATYYGGAVGGKLYDAASKTKLGKGIESTVGKAAETSPMAKPLFRALNKSGALDVADKAIDAAGTKGGSAPSSGSKNLNTSQNVGNPSLNNNMLKGAQAKTSTPVYNQKNSNSSINRGHNLVNPPVQTGSEIDDIINDETIPDEIKEELVNEKLREEELQKEALEKEEKRKKRKKNAKGIFLLIMSNPAAMFILLFALIALLCIVVLVYFIVSDMDLVGTQMTSYSQAETISGYCSKITLIKEHPNYSGDAVSSIDDVDLTETFKLGTQTVNRWESQTYDIESYVKGVLQAEALDVNDEKTFEVASIAARTYALQITSSNCYIWDNSNTRSEYKNPQNFTTDTPDSQIETAVSSTSGIVVTLDNELLNMDNENYYDYFCYTEKDVDKEEHSYFKMLQKNEEERLVIPIDWAKENVPGDYKLNTGDFNRSGKYDGQCQKEGMSLFGAKYLMNQEADSYSPIRVIKYYYGYDVELKRAGSAVAYGNGCYYWPTTSTRITSEFGLRTAPTEGASSNHGAIDIGVPIGSEVYATAAGTVTFAGAASGYGYAVYIDHGNGIESRYAHLKADGLKVSTGQTVTQGQVIALSGNTGISTGPHLHFEIRLNGTKVDPLNYVSTTDLTPDCSIIIAEDAAVDVGDSAKSICLSLKNYGFSNEAIAAIMTNMNYESSLIPTNLQEEFEGVYNDTTYTLAVDTGSYTNFVHDGYGYGIVQWTFWSRKQGLYNYKVQRGTSIGDVAMQIDYFMYELQNNYGGIYSTLKTPNTASYLTTQFCFEFESPENEETVCPFRGRSGNVTKFLNFANNNCQ